MYGVVVLKFSIFLIIIGYVLTSGKIGGLFHENLMPSGRMLGHGVYL
jgi:hypothetical protein